MKNVLLLLCALPLSTHATLLYVEFRGTVTSSDHPDYVVGDPFSESYIVDTALAPPDSLPDSPIRSWYHEQPCGCPSDFIRGSRDDPSLPGYDGGAVSRFVDGVSGIHDFYQLKNAYAIGTPERSWLWMVAELPNLVSNDSLVQSFEISSPEGTSGVYGFLQIGVEAARRTVWFAADLFSVTPTPGSFTCHR